PSPIKKERSPRPQSFCHSSSLSPQEKLSVPSFVGHRDRQRLSYSSFSNQVYGTSTESPTSPVADGPPLPPRNVGKAPLMAYSGSQMSHYVTLAGTRLYISTTKSTLGPRVLPKLPPKVALRKTDTIHHPSTEKSNQPPEVFQKSLQPSELPQKALLLEKPQLADLPPKPQISDLPPKPGELPPKPLLTDLPPKPQLGDLPPKPHIKDLPPKPQLSDIPMKPIMTDLALKPPSEDVVSKGQSPDSLAPSQQGEAVPRQPSEDTNGTLASASEMPVPLPRKINT
ncbi:hypothetical protein Z043_107582, partial [Scleropages formosus]